MKSEPWVGLTANDFYHKPPIVEDNWISMKKRCDQPDDVQTSARRLDPKPSVRKLVELPLHLKDPLQYGLNGGATSAMMKSGTNSCLSPLLSPSRARSSLLGPRSLPRAASLSAQICPDCAFLNSQRTDLSVEAIGVAPNHAFLDIYTDPDLSKMLEILLPRYFNGWKAMRKLRCGRALHDILCMFPAVAYTCCLSCITNNNNLLIHHGGEEDGEVQPLIPSAHRKSAGLKLKDVIAPTPTLAFHLKPKMVVMKVSMHCNGCARKVEKHISRLEGVSSYEIDLETKMVVVRGDIVPFEVLESVSKVKYAQLWEP